MLEQQDVALSPHVVVTMVRVEAPGRGSQGGHGGWLEVQHIRSFYNVREEDNCLTALTGIGVKHLPYILSSNDKKVLETTDPVETSHIIGNKPVSGWRLALPIDFTNTRELFSSLPRY